MRKMMIVLAFGLLVGCVSTGEKYYTCVDSAYMTTKTDNGYNFNSILKADPKVVEYCVDCIKAYSNEAAPYIALGLLAKSYNENETACDSFYVASRLGFPSFYSQYCNDGKSSARRKYSGAEFDDINRKTMEATANTCLQIAENIVNGNSGYPPHQYSRHCHLAALIYDRYPDVIRASAIIHYRHGNYKMASEAFLRLRHMKSKDYQPNDPVLCSDEDMRSKLPGLVEYCDKGPKYYTVPHNSD